MSGLDVARLREVAEGVPYCGPWRQGDAHVWTAGDRDSDEGPTIYVNGGVYANQRKTAEHIATFDPPTVLALLDRLEEAEAKVARVEALADRIADRAPEHYSQWAHAEVRVEREIREALDPQQATSGGGGDVA